MDTKVAAAKPRPICHEAIWGHPQGWKSPLRNTGGQGLLVCRHVAADGIVLVGGQEAEEAVLVEGQVSEKAAMVEAQVAAPAAAWAKLNVARTTLGEGRQKLSTVGNPFPESSGHGDDERQERQLLLFACLEVKLEAEVAGIWVVGEELAEPDLRLMETRKRSGPAVVLDAFSSERDAEEPELVTILPTATEEWGMQVVVQDFLRSWSVSTGSHSRCVGPLAAVKGGDSVHVVCRVRPASEMPARNPAFVEAGYLAVNGFVTSTSLHSRK